MSAKTESKMILCDDPKEKVVIKPSINGDRPFVVIIDSGLATVRANSEDGYFKKRKPNQVFWNGPVRRYWTDDSKHCVLLEIDYCKFLCADMAGLILFNTKKPVLFLDISFISSVYLNVIDEDENFYCLIKLRWIKRKYWVSDDNVGSDMMKNSENPYTDEELFNAFCACFQPSTSRKMSHKIIVPYSC